MKALLVILIGFVSFSAHAGRESHGLLPAGFECKADHGQESAYSASLIITDDVVAYSILKIQGVAQPELPCVDAWAAKKPGDNLDSTVFCARSQEREFLLELQESNARSQLKIWKIENDKSAKLVETLPCT